MQPKTPQRTAPFSGRAAPSTRTSPPTRIPKLREGACLPGAIAKAWARGVSTREVDDAAAEMGLPGMGGPTAGPGAARGPLGTGERAYLRLDATHIPCRDGSRVSRRAPVTAIATGLDTRGPWASR